MRLESDEHGYLYAITPSGEKLYILVDVPNCSHYGKLILGAPIEETHDNNDHRELCLSSSQ